MAFDGTAKASRVQVRGRPRSQSGADYSDFGKDADNYSDYGKDADNYSNFRFDTADY